MSPAPTPPVALIGLVGLVACAAPGSFPSLDPRAAELDRVISAPGQDQPADLSAEERRSLADDVAAARAGLATVKADIASAEAGLSAGLRAARGAPAASDPWANAQMHLSRFQDARAGLAAVDARLAPALLLSDDLADTDPIRAQLLALRAAIAAETERSAAVAGAAEASLMR